MAGTTSGLGWMAWTWQTAVFCIFIGVLLAGMVVWEWRSPGGAPRRGVLRIVTTRGDRLFISLLSAAYIHLGWLALLGTPLWGATLLSAGVAVLVFRYV
jgi:predicted small integral membrane protein